MNESGRSAQKRKAIMEAATTVFLDKGYLGTSMDEVAALAAVSKQTVYKHFADKERLFRAIVLGTVDRIEELFDATVTPLHETDDIERDLGQLARRFIGSLMRPDVLRLRRLVIAEAGRFPDVGRTWYELGFERVLGGFASALSGLGQRGLLRIDDPTVAANHFFGMILWIPINRVMFRGEDEGMTTAEIDRLADDGVRAFLAAYRPGS